MPGVTAAAPLIGAHVSISGGIEKAFARGEEVGCSAIQLFTRNASRWVAPPLKDQSIKAFREARERSGIRYVVAHDSYLINLASPDEELRLRSITTFLDEMLRCQQLGIPDLVMHPGAHVGSGVEAGLQQVIASFRTILSEAPAGVRILIENTAGQGSSLGARFEELATLLEAFGDARFAVCFDTCHAFAAGYDLRSAESCREVLAEFDRLIGLEQLALFHFNDSKKPLGSRVDRHDFVAKGQIGPAGFRAIMRDSRFAQVAKIIETPPGEDHCHDLETFDLLRAMAAGEI